MSTTSSTTTEAETDLTTETTQPTTTPREEASPPSGTASAAGNDFVAEPGPEFDPELAPGDPEMELEDELAVADEGWSEQTVKEILIAQGEVTHALFKAGPNDDETWKHTEDDLRRIAPPATRILNRYDVTRAAAVVGDEASLVIAVTTYATRNYVKRRRLLAELAAEPDRPITGVAADPGTGPEHDAEYQRTQGDEIDIRPAPPNLRPRGAI